MSASIKMFLYPSSELPSTIFCQDVLSNTRDRASDRPYQKDILNDQSADLAAADLNNIFEKGRALGYAEACAAERSECASQLRESEKQNIERAAKLANEFERLRSSYLQTMERELVRLALAIAARILRREVEFDPLLLTGTVRIALRQVADKTPVRMRVPADQAVLWSQTMDHLPNLSAKPVIVPDERLGTGECTLETDLGSADLGVRSQLLEVARTLFDNPGSSKDPDIAMEWQETGVPR